MRPPPDTSAPSPQRWRPSPEFPHDARYLELLVIDFGRWAAGGFGVPDFLDSLLAFQPQQHRVNGLQHLVVFPMYTQNGSSSRLVEAVLIEVIWPEFIAGLEEGEYSNKLFVPDPLPGFHPGLRHQLGRAVPGNRRRPRNAHLHVGRHLRGPGSCPLPPRPPRRRRHHLAWSCRPKPPNCWRTRSSPRKRSSCGTSSTTAPTCAATCPSIPS